MWLRGGCHIAPLVDFVQADGVDLEGIFETITLRDGIEVIAFGPQGEQRTLTPGHSLEAQSVFTFPWQPGRSGSGRSRRSCWIIWQRFTGKFL
jgi:hypothetical protein